MSSQKRHRAGSLTYAGDATLFHPHSPRADLSGTWMLNVFRLPAGDAGEQKALALTLSVPASPLAVPDASRLRLAVNDWEVLDARQFGATQPLPSAYGHTWRRGGVAVLLRTRVTSADAVPTVSVASVQDAAGADVKGRHDEARPVGR